MERLLQGPISHNANLPPAPPSCLAGEHYFERFVSTAEQGEEEEEEEEEEAQEETQLHYSQSSPSLDDTMPFLQMLQNVEIYQTTNPSPSPFLTPNFQTLLKLQHLKNPWDFTNSTSSCCFNPEIDQHSPQLVPQESCITHDLADLHSPVKSETGQPRNQHSSFSPEFNNAQCTDPSWVTATTTNAADQLPTTAKERRKRKRTKAAAKNKEEVESQRMTHITVERNRRRQMNEHLNSLRSLMPPSYVHRGDQASIIGGAIDFVKELEQLVQCLEAQKRMKLGEEGGGGVCEMTRSSAAEEEEGRVRAAVEKSEAAEIEVTAIQNHANLKVKCERRRGQLVRAIVGLEELGLTVLHLNIASSDSSTVYYSFNLKVKKLFPLFCK
ncbi:Transcription factor bHLH70 [Linum grandiflorum]